MLQQRNSAKQYQKFTKTPKTAWSVVYVTRGPARHAVSMACDGMRCLRHAMPVTCGVRDMRHLRCFAAA